MVNSSAASEKTGDTITVTVMRANVVFADRARLHIRVRGMSLVSAKMALTKAREVAALVAQLRSSGVATEEIEVTGVGIDVSSGSIIKTSEANYALRILCRSLDMMPDILGVISAQKAAQLVSIEWLYPGENASRIQWLDEAIEEANAKARRIAAALGVELLGVRQFTEAFMDDEAPDHLPAGSLGRARRMMDTDRQGPASIDIGININHSKSVFTHVHVDYRISGYATAGKHIDG